MSQMPSHKQNDTEDDQANGSANSPPEFVRFDIFHGKDLPDHLFQNEQPRLAANPRFVDKSNPFRILILTAADWANSRKSAPTIAGCAVVLGPSGAGPNRTCSFRLENEGPDGTEEEPTRKRAELRAVVAALQWYVGEIEGWSEVVIATSSSYVIQTALEDLKLYILNRWRTCAGMAGAPIENCDLWRYLVELTKALRRNGVNILFWPIPKSNNREACLEATRATDGPEIAKFQHSFA